MENVSILQAFFAFIFVIGLIMGLAYALKRWGNPQGMLGKKNGGRLHVGEVCYIDPKRKLVLVRRDEVEHLLLLGEHGATVIETGMTHGR